MRYIVFLSLCFVIGCTSKVTTNPNEQVMTPPSISENTKTIDGKELYEQKCTTCHGSDGKKGLAGAKDLSISTLTLDEKILIITDGKGTMNGFSSSLNEAQIKAIAEYTASLK